MAPTLGLALVCAACQASLELDDYAFGAGGTVPTFQNPPPGGASGGGAVGDGNMGVGGTGSMGASLPATSSESGRGGSLGSTGTLGGTGGGAPSNGGTGGSGGNSGFAKVCPDDELLIDDMETDPAALCPHYGRGENNWFVFTGSVDDVTTVTALPDPVVYEDIEGGRLGSARALHVVMATFDEDDFAGFGFNFAYLTGKIAAFDANRYGGLSLYARGSGRVLVRLPTADSTPVESGGRCVETLDEPCYNEHGLILELTDEWQLHEYSFADFMPAGYGPLRTFDLAELFGLSISPVSGQTDVDIWVDDIRFLPGDAP